MNRGCESSRRLESLIPRLHRSLAGRMCAALIDVQPAFRGRQARKVTLMKLSVCWQRARLLHHDSAESQLVIVALAADERAVVLWLEVRLGVISLRSLLRLGSRAGERASDLHNSSAAHRRSGHLIHNA